MNKKNKKGKIYKGNTKKKEKTNKNLISNIILILFIILFIFSSFKIIMWILNNRENKKIAEEISQAIITDEESNKWAIVLHGYRSNPESVISIGMHFSEKGYNVLIPSMRACSESDGEYIGMGWLDKDDLQGWINLIIEEAEYILEYGRQNNYSTISNYNLSWEINLQKNEKACSVYKDKRMIDVTYDKYGEDDVIRQYRDDRYPFDCDFYIPSEDLFIEINKHWTHGGKPFDELDLNDISKLEDWQERAKTSRFYKNAIYVWTNLDVRKQKCAKENNLNYKVIY